MNIVIILSKPWLRAGAPKEIRDLGFSPLVPKEASEVYRERFMPG
jgi:hypothetical protein